MPGTSFVPAVEEFAQLYQDWFRAIETHDRDWFDRTFTDDFVELIFIRDENGAPRTVQLDKTEFVTFDLEIEESGTEALAVDARVVGDHAVSWLLAKDSIVLGHDLSDGAAAVVEKIGFTGDVGAAVDDGMVALYSTAWRRQDEGWVCFSHQLVGVVG